MPISPPPDGFAARQVMPGATIARPAAGAEWLETLPALRVIGALLVVLFHSSISYLHTPLRTTLWVVYDSASCGMLDGFAAAANGLSMPLFFLVSGIATGLSSGGSIRRFVGRRARRLLAPLAWGCVTVLPITYLVWAYGLVVSERTGMHGLLRLQFGPEIQPYLYGLMHLWFLEFLFIIGVGWQVAVRGCGWILDRLGKGQALNRAMQTCCSKYAAESLALGAALLLICWPDVFLPINNAFAPQPERLLYFAWFYACGWCAARSANTWPALSIAPAWCLMKAAVAGVLLAPLTIRHMEQRLAGGARLAWAVLAALWIGWSLFGLLGLASNWHARGSRAVTYLAEASYWVYLVHLPVVAIMQITLLPLPWPAELKFLLAAAAALTFSLITYELCARRSLTGLIINGARLGGAQGWRWKRELGWLAPACVAISLVPLAAWICRPYLFHRNFHEVEPGGIYRSARLSGGELESLAERFALRSVICVAGGSPGDDWFEAQQEVCRKRGMVLHAIDLPPDRLPPAQQLLELTELLDQAPRPVLIQGLRGITRPSLAVAMLQLLDGAEPARAMRQFTFDYGLIGGAEHCAQARFILRYQQFMAEHRQDGPIDFRRWVQAQASAETQLAEASSRQRVLVGSPRYPAEVAARPTAKPR